MGCGTSKNGSPAGVPGESKAPSSQPPAAAAPAAKAAESLKEKPKSSDAPVIVVQTPATNLACEETGSPARAPPENSDKQPEGHQPAEPQARGEPGRVGDPAAEPPVTTSSEEVGPTTPSPAESAPADDARAPSREAADRPSSSADRTSPAERPSASRPGALPPILTRRPSEPNAAAAPAGAAEAPADASKLQSRFKSLAVEEEDAPPSPQMFAASRSLNRSIGVRRRTSDAEGGGGSTAGDHAAKHAEEERELAGPDPLREQFERDKENNPLLRRPTAMSARNSEKSMKSIKSKSSKRPSVGFALGEEEDDDVDPDAHLEAERIASITMPDEEPARAVRMAAVGLGLGPGPAEQRRSSGGGGRGGLRQGSR